MAICESSKRSLMMLSFCIIFVFLEIVQNCCARTTTTAHMNRNNKVDMCPQNKTEWQEASRRLNCSDDAKNPFNRYHCLPVHDLSALTEFCYNMTRPQVVKGMCMIYVQEINSLNGYNCTAFVDGCPDMFYLSDESYKFPGCLEIDHIGRCYVAESSCRSKTTPSTYPFSSLTIPHNGTFTFATPTNRTTNNKLTMSLTLFLPYLALLLFLFIVSVIYILIRRECKQKDNSPEDVPLLSVLDENTKAEIAMLGFEYILDKLPNDSSKYSLIAKELNIPAEILLWAKEKRGRFVERMKDQSITVYSGRGMVAGCAGAGKTTLIKKLKGEKNLDTNSTSGIEIHPHVFKLDLNKNTIIPLKEEEKQEELFSLTPITLDKPKKNKHVKSTVNNTNFTVNVEQRKQKITPETSASSGSVVNIDTLNRNDERTKERDQENTDSSSGPSRRNSEIFQEEDFERNNTPEQQTFNIENYTASVKEENLMMLSLLDFAGQSAYYACHHIFFSPRVFFILVVDMSKDLDKTPAQACNEPDLIYSSWTYADYIRYWLGSIHTYSSPEAPVILVASHSENTGHMELLKKYYLQISPIIPDQLRHHIREDRIFSVEKEHDKNIDDLKSCIASTLTSLDHWGENVPVAWNKLEYVLRTKSKDSKVYSFSDLQREAGIADEIFTNCKEDLITALKFFNDTGLILFRNEIQNENENVVILDVQWFVDAFKCIILDEMHFDKTKLNYNHKDINDLHHYGLLSSELLETLWDDSDLNLYKSNLVEHMKHLYMLAELKPESWYVPCMNKQKYSERVLDNCNVSSTLCFVFKFLPFDIYHRLIAACITKLNLDLWKRNKNEYHIYHTVTILKCKNTMHRLIIGIGKEEKDDEYPYSIEIQAIETKPRKPDIQFCSKIKENITQILLDLTLTFKSSGDKFQVGYLCTITPHKNPPQGHIILEDALKKKDVDCHGCNPVHMVDGKSILSFWEGMVTNVTSFPKTVDDEAAWETQTLESTIEAIGQKVKSYEAGILPEKKATPEDLIQLTKLITTATAKAVAAWNKGRQKDVIDCANMGRKAIFDLLATCRGTASTAETAEVRQKTIAAGKKCAVVYKDLLEHVSTVVQRPSEEARQTLTAHAHQVTVSVQEIVYCAELIKGTDLVDPEDPKVIVEIELNTAFMSIDADAQKLSQLKPQKKAKEADTSLNFEEQILEAAKSIAQAAAALVKSAVAATRELAAHGKIGATYHKSQILDDDGQWSDGLISTAKMIAAATHSLCESGNDLVLGHATEERIIASAKEVAGSTPDLLVAIGAKADLESVHMRRLQATNIAVKRATEVLVMSAQQAKQRDEDEDIKVAVDSRKVDKKLQELQLQDEVSRKDREWIEAREKLVKFRKQRYKDTGHDSD